MESFTPDQERSLRRKEAKRWEMECFNHARDIDKSLWGSNEAERHTGADSAAESRSEEWSLRREEAVRREMECLNHAVDVDKSLWGINKTEERHAGAASAAALKNRQEEPAKDAPQSSRKPDRK